MNAQAKWRIALLVLLVLSLAGNVFAFGFMAHQWRMARDTLTGRQEGRYSPEIRQAFRQMVRENRAPLRDALAELRAARDAQVQLATQSPLDEPALQAAMARVRSATDAVQTQLQGYLLEAIKQTDRP